MSTRGSLRPDTDPHVAFVDVNDELLLAIVEAAPGISSTDLFALYDAVGPLACRGTPTEVLESRTGKQGRMHGLVEEGVLEYRDVGAKRVWLPGGGRDAK